MASWPFHKNYLANDQLHWGWFFWNSEGKSKPQAQRSLLTHHWLKRHLGKPINPIIIGG